MTLRLFIFRHGETEWSLSGQHTGHTDIMLTKHGEEEARKLGTRIAKIDFSHVLVSPLQRAKRTCELAGLIKFSHKEFGLTEWDYGDYEGRTSADIRTIRRGWNLFHDGCPHGEMPLQMSNRVDRLIALLENLDGNVALFTHGHLGRVLAARWIGLSVDFAQHFLLNTASISILSYEHNQPSQPAILLWNSTVASIPQMLAEPSFQRKPQKADAVIKPQAIECWENEGGSLISLYSGSRWRHGTDQAKRYFKPNLPLEFQSDL